MRPLFIDIVESPGQRMCVGCRSVVCHCQAHGSRLLILSQQNAPITGMPFVNDHVHNMHMLCNRTQPLYRCLPLCEWSIKCAGTCCSMSRSLQAFTEARGEILQVLLMHGSIFLGTALRFPCVYLICRTITGRNSNQKNTNGLSFKWHERRNSSQSNIYTQDQNSLKNNSFFCLRRQSGFPIPAWSG